MSDTNRISVLDATTGGRHIWHPENKDPERVVFSDLRHVEPGELDVRRENWSVEPDVLADTRTLPFQSEAFDLVCYDPPHRVNDRGMQQLSGILLRKYGALRAETWQSDLRESFNELWRVLRPGGTLTFKWADETKSQDEVLSELEQTPLYGTTIGGGGTKWWVFNKGIATAERDTERTRVGHCKRDSTDVYIGRGAGGTALGDVPPQQRGGLGNPYTVEEYDREEAIEKFRKEFEERLNDDPALREFVASLAGDTLGCWCRSVDDDGPACHGDVIAEWADRLDREVDTESDREGGDS